MSKRLMITGGMVSLLLMLLVLPAIATSQENSGKGMNRQGSQSQKLHGNDPGQDQGSPHNTADPDCTGNRTHNSQATNNGECDAPTEGAADKPGGSGGFDADKDWNNGCGNDMDREDDNNGHCGKPVTDPPSEPEGNPPTNPPPGGPADTQVLGSSIEKAPSIKVASSAEPKPTAVLGAQFARSLPMTGNDALLPLLVGLALLGAGMAFISTKLKPIR